MSPRGLPFPPRAPRAPAQAVGVAACPGGASPVDGAQRPAPPRARALRLPPETAAAATAAAEVEAVGLGAQARCGSYPRRSTRMEKAGVDAQGHFVTTLLVTSRGGQGQSNGSRPAGSGIKKSSQKVTPSVVSVTKGADSFFKSFSAIADRALHLGRARHRATS